MNYPVFFISDATAITAETFGNSLLSQFENIAFTKQTLPFIDTVSKLDEVLKCLEQTHQTTGQRPIVFSSLIDSTLRTLLLKSSALTLDLFDGHLKQLETLLACTPSTHIGKAHEPGNQAQYTQRISAIDYTLLCDDGTNTHRYDQAELILMGVSRSGKTPTSLYLAIQFGIRTANYPLVEEELTYGKLSSNLHDKKDKLFGLTVSAERLHAIRSERRAHSTYANLRHCQHELKAAEHLFKRYNIPYLDATERSIEEIAAHILFMTGIQRHCDHPV